jgi:hypothetical protein
MKALVVCTDHWEGAHTYHGCFLIPEDDPDPKEDFIKWFDGEMFTLSEEELANKFVEFLKTKYESIKLEEYITRIELDWDIQQENLEHVKDWHK